MELMQSLFLNIHHFHYSHQLFFLLQSLTSYLQLPTLVFWLFFFSILASVMTLFSIKKVLNIRKVFFFLFNNDINIYYRRVLTTILSLSIIVPKTFLFVLVLFINLVDRRLLLSIKYISRENVSQLIFSNILIFFIN